MCHLFMEFSDMFDLNLPHTSDKIIVKLISENETLSKLDLEPKCQGQSKTKRQ